MIFDPNPFYGAYEFSRVTTRKMSYSSLIALSVFPILVRVQEVLKMKLSVGPFHGFFSLCS